MGLKVARLCVWLIVSHHHGPEEHRHDVNGDVTGIDSLTYLANKEVINIR